MYSWTKVRHCLIWVTASLFSTTACSTLPAAPNPPSTDEIAPSGMGTLFETADESKLRREKVEASALVRSLSKFNGVESARVHLSLADTSILLKSPQRHSTAAVLIVHSPQAPTDETAVREFVLKAVPTLLPENLSVVFTPSKEKPEPIVTIGYLRVAAESALPLKTTLAVLLLTALLTALGLIFAGVSIRKLKRTARAAAASAQK